MSTTKFPNAPKPIVGACSDGFPKPVAASVSEYSEFICFHEPLLACQSNPTVKPQVLRQVNQTALNPEPKFQTTVKPDLSKPFVDVYDPWNEDVHQMEELVNSHNCFKGSVPVKVPSLLKVGEDPYDPWNIYECDVDLWTASMLWSHTQTKPYGPFFQLGTTNQTCPSQSRG